MTGMKEQTFAEMNARLPPERRIIALDLRSYMSEGAQKYISENEAIYIVNLEFEEILSQIKIFKRLLLISPFIFILLTAFLGNIGFYLSLFFISSFTFLYFFSNNNKVIQKRLYKSIVDIAVERKISSENEDVSDNSNSKTSSFAGSSTDSSRFDFDPDEPTNGSTGKSSDFDSSSFASKPGAGNTSQSSGAGASGSGGGNGQNKRDTGNQSGHEQKSEQRRRPSGFDPKEQFTFQGPRHELAIFTR